jgi:hypothetical protein
MGGISYDDEKRSLVKTYTKGLEREPDRRYLLLDRPPVNLPPET